ncbi:hypothetical protein NDU88_001780 [Pleurodeles waltl]|uniref:Uncharacterized protein n=1 Tax=Pleurodeles waltl TaxID=8319 RepID=A0AAV7Q7U8_PLEWA|nr:hypothetical protein NDU88_001780 [Pleurodeles waltl]
MVEGWSLSDIMVDSVEDEGVEVIVVVGVWRLISALCHRRIAVARRLPSSSINLSVGVRGDQVPDTCSRGSSLPLRGSRNSQGRLTLAIVVPAAAFPRRDSAPPASSLRRERVVSPRLLNSYPRCSRASGWGSMVVRMVDAGCDGVSGRLCTPAALLGSPRHRAHWPGHAPDYFNLNKCHLG